MILVNSLMIHLKINIILDYLLVYNVKYLNQEINQYK
jgi:hypothetical protein